jgi:uncharacterized membrane protein
VTDGHHHGDGHGHGHSHGHGYEGPSLTADSARRLLTWVVGGLAALTLIGLAVLWPRGDPEVDRESLGYGERARATVSSAETEPCSYEPSTECRLVFAELTSGPDEGSEARLETSISSHTPASTLDAGDKIILNDAGAEVPAEDRYSFADVERRSPLLVLVLLFAVAVVALGRRSGLFALVGVALSLGVLLVFVFPALLRGSAPIAVAMTGAAVIAFGVLYLAHGVNERTTVALLGTLASLALTAVLAVTFAGAAQLSGLASEESLQLLTFAPELDFRGLLLAAVVIGTLGVLDDVTVTQVAAVWELHRTDPGQGRRQLYRSATRIGRDHIASTVNTLVLAYAAAALPLMLLFTQSGLALGDVLTTETIAVEVVQTLVGSIGLVASVPITTALASWLITLPGRRSDPDLGDVPDAGPVPGPEPEPVAPPRPWWGEPPPHHQPAPPAVPPPQPAPSAPSEDELFWGRRPDR